MTDNSEQEGKGKKERSPPYPFISLRKAVDRAAALYERHRREPARLVTIAPTWGYAPKSSGLQQTVGALKQFGLVDETGSGDERRVQISELARKILADQRPGAREQGLREAALKPRLMADYSRWFSDRPSDEHCISELVFDRGFNEEAARAFLKSFDDTVQFAGLSNSDSLSSSQPEPVGNEEPRMTQQQGAAETEAMPGSLANIPLSRRLEMKTSGEALTVSARLVTRAEVKRLIRMLEVSQELLDVENDEPPS